MSSPFDGQIERDRSVDSNTVSVVKKRLYILSPSNEEKMFIIAEIRPSARHTPKPRVEILATIKNCPLGWKLSSKLILLFRKLTYRCSNIYSRASQKEW